MAFATQKNNFTKKLLKWNRDKNSRVMPWKGEKDPYKIWLSEIILQQTRVEQGLNYYNRFVKEFPDIHKLAKTSEKKVFKMWEGLGYYTRCRNLLIIARYISNEKKGRFPASYNEIKNLKGVGPYTAAAISSFAYNLPYAVVDGNVFRVLSRVFGIKTPVDTAKGKKQFAELADELLDKKQPGVYNQSIMDFGALICKPVAPLCSMCPFNDFCFAWLHKSTDTFPVKEKKTRIRHRWFYYLIAEHNSAVYIRQRTYKDIWRHLYEFYLTETSEKKSLNSIDKLVNQLIPGTRMTAPLRVVSQQLSHQLIHAYFIQLQVKKKPGFLRNGLWVKKNRLKQFAFPGIIREFLKDF
jgi:A/G-specific adenine glycosylase